MAIMTSYTIFIIFSKVARKKYDFFPFFPVELSARVTVVGSHCDQACLSLYTTIGHFYTIAYDRLNEAIASK